MVTQQAPLCACAGSMLAGLLAQVEGEELPAHRIVLTARSPVFHALLNSGMREGAEGVVKLGANPSQLKMCGKVRLPKV